MYCEGIVRILDDNDCRAATMHVFIYTHTPSAADSLRPRDVTQCTDPRDATDQRHVTIANLRRQADNDQQLFGLAKTLDVLLGVEHAPDRPTVSSPSNQSPSYEFDPRTILTVKASTKKAVHITQFLPEATRKKRDKPEGNSLCWGSARVTASWSSPAMMTIPTRVLS